MEYGLKSKLNYGYEDEFFEYKCLYYYYAAYIYEENIKDIANVKKSITLRAADFCAPKNDEIYTTTYVSISDLNDIKQEDLLYGSLPTKENEVLVIENYADENEITEEDLGVKQYRYYDIYKEKYNGFYDCYLNIYDYFKNGVVVTGIIRNSIDNEGEVFINHEKLESIKRIYEFENLISNIEPVLYIIMTIIVIVNVVMIATFISISIGENTRNIGILRALGVSGKNCIQIFNFEFVVIYVMSMLVAGIGLAMITEYINGLFMQSFHDVKFNIIVVNTLVVGVVVTVEFIVGRISSRIPILKLKKKNLIEIIKE